MPSFNAESPDLEADGPVVEVSFGLVPTAEQALVNAGTVIPPPVKASALIDTGAGGTAVQRGLLVPLGLHPVGSVLVNTPTDQNVPCPQYAVKLVMPNGYLNITVIETELQGQNIQALIGRDVLRHAVLIYQGPTSQFTLSF